VIWKNCGQVGVSYLLTALIGWEREHEAHSAGLRTFPLVGMASCGYLLILGAHPDSADQSRVLQGLITGIGFVGGGAILREGATVRGTATAASVWNAGVIGASVAMGALWNRNYPRSPESCLPAGVAAAQELDR
jgi:putative Mg2+ transporter-C (MgtC) family protein